ncbi:hypothetical protein [uncultured Tateyamaria sp.]|uniref:hypothetical protein n=1 Tax=uncultured Tateyamaria sp. TaxID=455651 RepID=UPI00261CFF36|nr:hypothetical protein [uncultured Tateyamaria sp.]
MKPLFDRVGSAVVGKSGLCLEKSLSTAAGWKRKIRGGALTRLFLCSPSSLTVKGRLSSEDTLLGFHVSSTVPISDIAGHTDGVTYDALFQQGLEQEVVSRQIGKVGV